MNSTPSISQNSRAKILGRACLMAVLAFLSYLPLCADPVPILLYEFNQSTDATTTPSTGSDTTPATLKPSLKTPTPVLSKDGEGVSGKPGDIALDLRGATGMGKNGEGGVAIVSHPQLEGLKSFTAMGWFKATVAPSDGARLFDYSAPKAGFLIGMGNGSIGIQVNGQGWNSQTLPAPPAGSWVFFAISYDSTKEQDNLVFYECVAGGDFSIEQKSVHSPEAVAANPTGILAIGNWPSGQRPLQGLLDKMAIYGSTTDGSGALSPTDVQAIANAANAAH